MVLIRKAYPQSSTYLNVGQKIVIPPIHMNIYP